MIRSALYLISLCYNFSLEEEGYRVHLDAVARDFAQCLNFNVAAPVSAADATAVPDAGYWLQMKLAALQIKLAAAKSCVNNKFEVDLRR